MRISIDHKFTELPLLRLALQPYGAGIVGDHAEAAGLILPEAEAGGDDVSAGVTVGVGKLDLDRLRVRLLLVVVDDDRSCGRAVGGADVVVGLDGLEVDGLAAVLRLVDFFYDGFRRGSGSFFLLATRCCEHADCTQGNGSENLFHDF